MAEVTFRSVSKQYDGDGPKAVDSLDLDIKDGEFMVLVGPSGCGKSTALRMIAGLEEVTDGELLIGDRLVNDVPPGDRDIAMVFQNYALYPHMTVRENISFALEVAKVKKAEIKARTEEAAEMLGLMDYLDRLPKALSGGQRQRVAMGRAIVRSPQVFLMDEPLSNLDAKLRVQMRSEIIQIQRRLDTTMVYVTHDQIEAMTMGHRVAVMRLGVLQQVADPQELYQRPANLFVAAFIGSPAMNLINVTLGGTAERPTASFAGHTLAIDPRAVERYPQVADRIGSSVVLGLRPEHFSIEGDFDLP
ncbi:MAG: multiple sugar transport system ATP-binding protein, partial [Ilumatobacter sp.]